MSSSKLLDLLPLGEFEAGRRSRDAEVDAARKDIETLYHIISEKDAEVARLVEALRYAVSIIGHPDDAGTKMLVALLREYEEKRDE